MKKEKAGVSNSIEWGRYINPYSAILLAFFASAIGLGASYVFDYEDGMEISGIVLGVSLFFMAAASGNTGTDEEID